MTTGLLFVDVQRNMLEGETAIPAAAANRAVLVRLLAQARASGAVVVHVQNDGPADSIDEPGSPGWELVIPAAPGELVVRKDVFDTFAANPELARTLRDQGIERVVVAGMQSEYCIQATARAALDNGFEVLLASGAHATYDDDEANAADISARVEKELAAAGVQVEPVAGVRF